MRRAFGRRKNHGTKGAVITSATRNFSFSCHDSSYRHWPKVSLDKTMTYRCSYTCSKVKAQNILCRTSTSQWTTTAGAHFCLDVYWRKVVGYRRPCFVTMGSSQQQNRGQTPKPGLLFICFCDFCVTCFSCWFCVYVFCFLLFHIVCVSQVPRHKNKKGGV